MADINISNLEDGTQQVIIDLTKNTDERLNLEADENEFLNLESNVLSFIEPLVAISLAQNSHTHDMLETLYHSNEDVFYKSYLSSPLKDEPLFNCLTIEKQLFIKKIIGILANDSQSIVKIIKKNHKKLFNYVKNTKKITLKKVYDLSSKKIDPRKNQLIRDINSFHIDIMAIYLCLKLESSLEFNSYNHGILTSIDTFYHTKDYEKMYIQPLNTLLSNLNPQKREINKLWSMYGFNKITQSLGELMGSYIDTESSKHIKKNLSCMFTKNIKTLNRNTLISTNNFVAALTVHSTFLRFCNLSDTHFLENLMLTPDDINSVFLTYLSLQQTAKFNDTARDFLIAGMLFQKGFTNEYFHSKTLNLESSYDDFYLDLVEKSKLLSLEKDEFTMKEEALSQKSKSDSKIIDELQRQVELLESDRNKLKIQLQKSEDNKLELNALREYIFTQDIEYKSELNSIDEDTIHNSIKDKKIVILGGDPKWSARFKELFPNYDYIAPENKGLDLSFIKNRDLVLINTAVNNHTLYEKAMKYVKSSQIPLVYVNNSLHPKRCANLIYENIF